MQRACVSACSQNAPMTDKQRIRAWYNEVLRETGWSAAHWARLAKTSPTNITRLQKTIDAAAPRTETLQKLYRVLPNALRDKAPGFLFSDSGPMADLAEPPPPAIADRDPTGATLPVLSESGALLARVKAPPSLAEVKGAYAVYVRDGSMEPRYFEGDTVYINPVQPPRLNDFVILRLTNGNSLIRRLIDRDGTGVRVELYNPPGTPRIDRAEVTEIHRILNSDELWR